ncbi:MAG: hypothetical protein AVDCRST_MAG64-663, partial [uncultured Phycisphaerae bacterium]
AAGSAAAAGRPGRGPRRVRPRAAAGGRGRAV